MSREVTIVNGQDALDLDDAQTKLRLIARAVEVQERWDGEVARLKRELKHAQRKALEARWDVGATARRVARHVKERGAK